MSREITFREATQKELPDIAERMREQDMLECLDVGMDPLEALEYELRVSDFAYTCFVDGVPAFICGGIVIGDGDRGLIWGLSTDVCEKNPKAMLEYGRKVAEIFLSICPSWEAATRASYTLSVKWLKKIGFSVGEEMDTIIGKYRNVVLERRA